MKAAGVDYIALATRLRAVHGARSERAQAENADKKAAGGVALDDILNALDSGALDSVVDDVLAKTKQQLRETDARYRADQAHPYRMAFDNAYLPTDPFERRVVKFFAERREFDPPRHLVARAIVSALADATDHGGVLGAQQVAETLGHTGLQLLLQVKGQTTSTTTRAKLKHQELDPLTLQKVARSRDRTTFVERMPLLAEITKQLGSSRALAGFQMVSVQHLFPSTLGLYDALKDNGLVRNETGVGGKNYSSNADAVARLVADGHDVHPLALPEPQDAGLDAEELVYTMAESQLATLFRDVDPKETRPRFLLLDDGGKLIRALHEQFPQFAHLCVAVEQTDRGIQHIEMMAREGHELACPVVNMARSVAKKDHEGPMIGESVVFHAEHELRATSPELLALVEKDKTATVVGYGAVGKATADALLRRGYTVFEIGRAHV